jgi:phosphoenolpyruvate carboxylase
MTRLAALDQRLQELHARTAETPLFNPVFQLGLELSRELESGMLSLSELEALVAELECQGLQSRAERLARLAGPVDPALNDTSIARLADQEPDFAAFAARWAKPLAHIVFTAHPTFLLARAQGEAVAQSASAGAIGAATTCVAPPTREPITLDSEHAQAMAALAHAQTARDRITGLLFAAARKRRCGWPAGSAMTWTAAPTSPGQPRCVTASRKRLSGWRVMARPWEPSRPIWRDNWSAHRPLRQSRPQPLRRTCPIRPHCL